MPRVSSETRSTIKFKRRVKIRGLDDNLRLVRQTRRDDERLVPRQLLLRQQGDEATLRSRLPVLSINSAEFVANTRPASIAAIGPSRAPSMAAVEIDAHAGLARASLVDQAPELPTRQRIDSVVGSSRISKVRLVDRARRGPFCFIRRAPLDGWERASPVTSSGPDTRRIAPAEEKPKQPRHEVDVRPNTQLVVQVLAQTLGHVGDLRANGATVPRVGHVAVKHRQTPPLDSLRAGDQGHQGRFTHPVGTNHADHAAGRDVEGNAVEGHGLPIAVRNISNGHHRCAGG